MEFESLLKLMVHKNGSDLFITAGVAPSLKVNGKISPVTQATLTPIQAKEIVTGIMTPAQKEEFLKKTTVRTNEQTIKEIIEHEGLTSTCVVRI